MNTAIPEMCGLRTGPLADADPQQFSGPRTDADPGNRMDQQMMENSEIKEEIKEEVDSPQTFENINTQMQDNVETFNLNFHASTEEMVTPKYLFQDDGQLIEIFHFTDCMSYASSAATDQTVKAEVFDIVEEDTVPYSPDHFGEVFGIVKDESTEEIKRNSRNTTRKQRARKKVGRKKVSKCDRRHWKNINAITEHTSRTEMKKNKKLHEVVGHIGKTKRSKIKASHRKGTDTTEQLGGNAPQKCKYCHKLIYCQFARHIQTHLDTKPFTCIQYNKRRHKLKAHKDIHKDQICAAATNGNANTDGKLNDALHNVKDDERGLEVHNTEESESSCSSVQNVQSEDKPQNVESNDKPHDKPLACEHCGQCFAESSSLASHRCHFRKTEHNYKCSGKQKVNKSAKSFRCDQCGRSLISAKTLADHIELHNIEYTCPVCNKQFTQRKVLNAHMKRHQRLLMCQVCGARLTGMSSLTAHMATHSGCMPFSCEHCGKTYARSDKLKLHLITHSDSYGFRCEKCGQKYVREENYIEHLALHSDSEAFICQTCGKSYASQQKLVMHTYGTHKYKHTCPVCGHLFARANKLKIHMRIHTGLKPFVCANCDMKFSRRDKLVKHMRKHLSDSAAATNTRQSVPNGSISSCTDRDLDLGDIHINEVMYVDEAGDLATTVKQLLGQEALMDVLEGLSTSEIYKGQSVDNAAVPKSACSDLIDPQIGGGDSSVLGQVKSGGTALPAQSAPDTITSSQRNESAEHSLRPKHQKRRAKVRQFECTMCDSVFRLAYRLMRHVNSVHFKEQRYSCDICHRDYSRNDHMLRHRKTHWK